MIGYNNKKNQQGGALLIAMVLIFMLSIMGVSAMKGSSLERRMANNSVQSAATFQAAESVTDLVLNDKANLELAWEGQSGPYKVPNINLKNSFGYQQGAEAEYLGDGPAPGYSTGVNNSGAFAALQYEVRGATVMKESNTASAVIQGAYRIAPGM
jgi:Tfp pilus assembly protein PilX